MRLLGRLVANCPCSGFYDWILQVRELAPEAKEKIRNLTSADIPIEERRSLHNAMRRKMEGGIGLKPGLLEKYQACGGSRKARFELLKEFMIDENMS